MSGHQARADWRDWLGLLLTPGMGPRQAWQSLQQQPLAQAWAKPPADWPVHCAALALSRSIVSPFWGQTVRCC